MEFEYLGELRWVMNEGLPMQLRIKSLSITDKNKILINNQYLWTDSHKDLDGLKAIYEKKT